jgi:hypothetical protein
MLNVVESITKPKFLEDIRPEDDDDYFGEVIVEEKPRMPSELQAAEHELFEKVWFQRHMNSRCRVKMEDDEVAPEIWERATAAAQRIIDTYGEKNLGPYTDFELGMLNGKLSAVRWAMGSEWDFLDT